MEETEGSIAGPRFLVVDFQRESRFLLVKTLARKFPGATILECEDAEQALQSVRLQNLACVVTHRTFDTPGVEVVRQLREADPLVPIVMVSGMDREKGALAAGATCFLRYEEWLRIGSVVESLITARRVERAKEGESDRVT